jgi:hypothetical protein
MVEFDMATLLTVLGSVMTFLAGQRGVKFAQDRWGNGTPQPPSPPEQWADVTGEHRPMLASECAARHADLSKELQRGKDQFGDLNDSITELRVDIKTGFAGIPGDISKAIQAGLDRHEDREHKD